MPRDTRSILAHTLEEFPFTGEFGPDLIDVEVSIAYAVCPYDPGCRYTPNGDGWPPSGGGVEDVDFTVKSATSYDENGRELRFSPAEFPVIKAEINRRYEEDETFRERIDAACIEDAGDGQDEYIDRLEAALTQAIDYIADLQIAGCEAGPVCVPSRIKDGLVKDAKRWEEGQARARRHLASEEMLEVLESVYHQLSTDSDLDSITGAAKYDALEKMVGQAIAAADPANPQIRFKNFDDDAAVQAQLDAAGEAWKRAIEKTQAYLN